MSIVKVNYGTVGGGASGTFTAVSGENTVTCGFKPRFVALHKPIMSGGTAQNNSIMVIYDENVSASVSETANVYNGTAYYGEVAVPTTQSAGFGEPTATGFTFKANANTTGIWYWFAVK